MPAFRCVCPFCGEEPRKGERHNCKPLQEVRNVSSPVEKASPPRKAPKIDAEVHLKSASGVLEDLLAILEPNRSLQKTSQAMSKCSGADFLVSFLLVVAPGCFHPLKDPKRALMAALATLRDSAARTLQRSWRQRSFRSQSVPKKAFEPSMPALVQVTPELKQVLMPSSSSAPSQMKQALGRSGWANDLFQEFLGGLGQTGAHLATEDNQIFPTPQTTTSTSSAGSAGNAPSSISSVTSSVRPTQSLQPQAPAVPRSANGSKRPKRSSSRTSSGNEVSLTSSPENACDTAQISVTGHHETMCNCVNDQNAPSLRLESLWDNLDGPANCQAIQPYGLGYESVTAKLENEASEEIQPVLTPLERRALREQTALQNPIQVPIQVPTQVPPSPSMGRALPQAAATNRLSERLQRRKDGAESCWRTELGTRDPTSLEIVPDQLDHVPLKTSSGGAARKDALARLQNKQAQRQQDVVLLED